MTTETLRPNASGDEETITYGSSGGGNHWQDVDEVEASDADYLQQFTSWGRDLYNLPASTGTGTINKITLYFRVWSMSASACVKGAIKSDSTVTETTEKDPYNAFGAETFGVFSQEWNTNPVDSQPWEWDDIDSLQIGISLEGLAGFLCSRCSQVYVVVDYTESASGGSSPVKVNMVPGKVIRSARTPGKTFKMSR